MNEKHLKDYNELYDCMVKFGGSYNFDLVKKAFERCVTAHEGQKRQTDEDYYIHPFNVAKIIVSLGLDSQSIAAALLHDVVEDTDATVEDIKNVFLFEKLGMFNGKYHVLEGLISPLDGINPEDIGLDKLIDRINEEEFKEIIFAFKPSIEGETTSLYIKRILDGMNIKVTRLASGVPIGADMEYVDSLTLERALSDRKAIE